MSAASQDAPLLLPPPGPLAWLHPEFAQLERALLSSTDQHARNWNDLARLERELREHPAHALELPAGPRCGALREALWSRWGPASPNPLEYTLRTTERVPSLEAELRRAAAGAQAETLIATPEQAGARGIRFEGRALDARTAEEVAADPDAVWLLPLHPGQALERRLEQLVGSPEADLEAWREARLVPFFLTDGPGAPEAPVFLAEQALRTVRLAASWWGLLPGDRYSAAERTATRELVRLLHPERALACRALENEALAGFDVYLESLAQPSPPSPRERANGPLVIAVCGIDGAGKTHHVDALQRKLEARGLTCARHKLFRHGVFHETVTNLVKRTHGERDLHLWRIQRLVKVFDSLELFRARIEPDAKRADVLLFDRYVFTHRVAGTGRLHRDPGARAMLASLPEADRVYLLDLSAEDALARIDARSERTVDENPYMLGRYREKLLDQADRDGFLVLDARRPFEENHARIWADLERQLPAPATEDAR